MSVYSFLLKLNGVDVSTYGFTVGDLLSNWDAPVQAVDEAAIPGQDGTTATSLEVTLEPRDYKLWGILQPAAGTAAAFESAIDTLKLALYSSSLTIIGGNQSARQRTGVFAGMTTSMYALMESARIEITIRCRNPVAYATSTTTVSGATTTDLACALGTYRCRPVITLTFSGSTSNTVLTYKNSAGTTVQTMTITHAFVNTDVLVVDMGLKTITLNGTRHDEYLTAGDFFALNPQDGVFGTSTWPTVRSSVGAVTSIVYRQAWL